MRAGTSYSAVCVAGNCCALVCQMETVEANGLLDTSSTDEDSAPSHRACRSIRQLMTTSREQAAGPAPIEVLMQLVFGAFTSRAVTFAADAGIADLLRDGPRSAAE